jgi:hypothetical protein
VSVRFESLGEQASFRSIVRDGGGVIVSPSVVWTSSSPGVVQVARDGTATAMGNGSAEIAATALGARATASVIVEQTFSSFQFVPTPYGLESGEPIGPLVVQPVDALGSALVGATGSVTLDLMSSTASLRSGPLSALLGSEGARFESVIVDGTQAGAAFTATWDGHVGQSNPFDVVSAFDRVLLPNAGPGARGLLVDGEVGGERANDLGVLAEGEEIAVGAVRRTAGNNELIVFGDGHAPALVSSVPWTEGVDTVTVDLPAPVRVGMTVWIVKGPFETQRSRAQTAAERTTAIWSAERHGVVFDEVEYVDATENPKASDFYEFDLCGKRADAETQIGKRDGHMNVYYVERVDGGLDRGRACPVGGDFAVMAERSGDELLSHEIGHLFSLRHVDHLAEDFDRTNVMHSASSTRRYLTEAQTFRVHHNQGSVINGGLDLRPGLPVRNCPRDAVGPGCPAIALRLWADGGFLPNLDQVLSELVAPLAGPEALVTRWLDTSCLAEDNRDLDVSLAALGDLATPLLVAAYERTSIRAGPPGAASGDLELRRRLAALHGLGLVNTVAARRALLELVGTTPSIERREALRQLSMAEGRRSDSGPWDDSSP